MEKVQPALTAGQYQQSPAPPGGGLVKAEWFKHYRENERPAPFDRIVQSWDTANKATELSDFSVCTTWGVKGKDLFLLGVLRRRLEYPALKRAVREQHSLFGANVVLIEDKASGTQLIQELIQDGCYGVTRYQPTTDKIMRMHAQTAMIENGFIRIPEDAPWLAEYLHEMIVFPKGKHDDQVDSTAQFLDWFKKPMPNWGIFECTRQRAQEIAQQPKDRERHRVLLEGPLGMSVQTLSGRHLEVAWDGRSKCLPMMRHRSSVPAGASSASASSTQTYMMASQSQRQTNPRGLKSTTLKARWNGKSSRR